MKNKTFNVSPSLVILFSFLMPLSFISLSTYLSICFAILVLLIKSIITQNAFDLFIYFYIFLYYYYFLFRILELSKLNWNDSKKNDYKNNAVVQINKSHSQSVIHSLTHWLTQNPLELFSHFPLKRKKKNQNNENHSKFIITN